MNELIFEPYREQLARWPRAGRHVLAQFDDEHIVVYQAYRSAIGHYAAKHQRFGGEFSFSRMTWVKPNFLWMMYRSGWGTKVDQEITLALVVKRVGFDTLLAEAVASTHDNARFPTREAWQRAIDASNVRLQWDPDHDPSGAPQARRALQLGLRGEALRRLNEEWLVAVRDVSDFVTEQRSRDAAALVLPRERVYPLGDATRAVLGADTLGE